MTNANRAIGQRIKLARKLRKLTLEQMAEHLGVTIATVSRYEVGDRQPKYDRLFKIAKLLDVSVQYLLAIPEEKLIKAEIKVIPGKKWVTGELHVDASDEKTINLTGLGSKEIEVLRNLIEVLQERKEKQTRSVPSESKQEKKD